MLGPSARKTAYRYRGTEEARTSGWSRSTAAEVERNKKYGPIDPWAAQGGSQGPGSTRVQTPFGPEAGGRAPGRSRLTDARRSPPLTQMVARGRPRRTWTGVAGA